MCACVHENHSSLDFLQLAAVKKKQQLYWLCYWETIDSKIQWIIKEIACITAKNWSWFFNPKDVNSLTYSPKNAISAKFKISKNIDMHQQRKIVITINITINTYS